MPYYYKAFGLSIWAESYLPLIEEAREVAEPNLRIFTQSCPPDIAEQAYYGSAADPPDNRQQAPVWWRLTDGGFLLRFPTGYEFSISGSGDRVWSTDLSGESLIDASIHLIGTVFGLALHLRGIPCLHAGAVVVAGKAILFAGHAGFGKSSITSALALRGYPVLTDDVAAMIEESGGILIPPAIPSIRLRTEPASALFGNGHELPLISENWRKYNLKLMRDKSPTYASRPFPPGEIYVMENDEVELPQSSIFSELTRQEALIKLSTLGYFSSLPDKKMLRQRFELLSALVEKVPVRRLPRLHDPRHLSELCDGILDDLGETTRVDIN